MEDIDMVCIGVIGAMEEEVSSLIQQMEDAESKTLAGMTFYHGTLWNQQAVVVKSGVGKVNMAVCTQILVDVYEVDMVINTGVAGGLYKDINVGDIVISSDALQHDMDATGFGYEVGVIPRMPVSVFEADRHLIDLAKEACEKVNPDIKVFTGRVVSGDQFVSDKEKKKWLVETFHGYCTEMEGAAIAQAAYLNGIPFLIVRAISDKADDSANMDYAAFERKAIEHSVNLMMEMCSQL